MGRRIDVVAGAQFGSEGKGMVAGELARHRSDLLSIRVGGPNAGHCVIDETGRKWAFRALPVATVLNDGPIAIGPGSEIDLEVLREEVKETMEAGHRTLYRLFIDPEATIIEPHHRNVEAHLAHGTTGKGIGAARAERLLRQAKRWGDAVSVSPELERHTGYTEDLIEEHEQVLIEGTQGFGLGSHAGFYPYCTSGDCRVIDFVAQAGVPWYFTQYVRPILVARTHPIRIAGNSGPLYGETTWAELRLPDEYTTVTKKVRRVGEWDSALVRRAVQANGGPQVELVLTMLDHEFPEISGHYDVTLYEDPMDYVRQIEDEIGYEVSAVGTGPRHLVPLRRQRF